MNNTLLLCPVTSLKYFYIKSLKSTENKPMGQPFLKVLFCPIDPTHFLPYFSSFSHAFSFLRFFSRTLINSSFSPSPLSFSHAKITLRTLRSHTSARVPICHLLLDIGKKQKNRIINSKRRVINAFSRLSSYFPSPQKLK